jgi:hypothetical protein
VLNFIVTPATALPELNVNLVFLAGFGIQQHFSDFQQGQILQVRPDPVGPDKRTCARMTNTREISQAKKNATNPT